MMNLNFVLTFCAVVFQRVGDQFRPACNVSYLWLHLDCGDVIGHSHVRNDVPLSFMVAFAASASEESANGHGQLECKNFPAAVERVQVQLSRWPANLNVVKSASENSTPQRNLPA